MAIKTNYSRRSVPNIGTKRSQPITTNFAKGIYTYKPNDTMESDEIRLAQDARFDRVGEYGTRKGLKALSSNIIGLTADGDLNPHTMISVATLTGAATMTYFQAKRICGARITAKLVGDASLAPIVKFSLYINQELVDSSCLNPADLTTAEAQYDILFNSAPDVPVNGYVEVKASIQSGESTAENDVLISGRTTALIAQILTCTPGGVDSIFEANIDGTKTVLFTHNGILYRMAANGTMTAIRTLPAGAGTVRYSQNLNQIRYVCGKEAPHLIDPGSAWADSAIAVKDLKTDTTMSVTMRNIMNGPSDNLIYFASDPDTEALWTYPYGYSYAKSPAYSTTERIDGQPGDTLTIQSSTVTPAYPTIAVGDWITGQGRSTAEVTAISGSTISLTIVDTTPHVISSYDKFDVDFYQNFPAIKTGDPITAMFNLAGVLYFQTRRNKYQMYMQSADAWTQSASNAQGGTFSQESVVCDLNYAYYANDNGVYRFNGSAEESLTQSKIQNVYDAIEGKESIRLDLFNNRLYIFYSSKGNGTNDSCLVYNINLHVWESFDANTFVGATSARQNASGRFLCGHSRIGLIMLNEDDTGDYSDLGQPLAFNLETSYQHFGSTSQLKRITKWRPEFATTERAYTVECGYALDFTDQVKYAFSMDLQRQVPVNTNYVWDNPSDYGVPAIPTMHTTTTKVNGDFYRCQIRYQHIAAFEPVIFRSHTTTIQTQRIR